MNAVIVKDPEFDHFRRVERVRWRIDFEGDGSERMRRKFTRTRREAVEFCNTIKVPYQFTQEHPCR